MKPKLFYFLLWMIGLNNANAQIGNLFTISNIKYKVLTQNNTTNIGTVEVAGDYENYAYAGNPKLSLPATVINDGITYAVIHIGKNAFKESFSGSGNSVLTHVDLSRATNLTSIGSKAFEKCIKITSIHFPNSLTSIGVNTFRDCSSLTSISFPSSLTHIGNGAFQYCTSLISADVSHTKVTNIGQNTFSGCSSLTSVIFPNSLTNIGSVAFMNCTSLTSITFPNFLTSIGRSAFQNCSSLTSADLSLTKVANIGRGAFRYSALTSVTFPSSLTNIGRLAFESCLALTSVRFSTSLPRIESDAFYGCTALLNVSAKVPESNITTLRKKVFLSVKPY